MTCVEAVQTLERSGYSVRPIPPTRCIYRDGMRWHFHRPGMDAAGGYDATDEELIQEALATSDTTEEEGV